MLTSVVPSPKVLINKCDWFFSSFCSFTIFFLFLISSFRQSMRKTLSPQQSKCEHVDTIYGEKISRLLLATTQTLELRLQIAIPVERRDLRQTTMRRKQQQWQQQQLNCTHLNKIQIQKTIEFERLKIKQQQQK